jgi:hypothetical protein
MNVIPVSPLAETLADSLLLTPALVRGAAVGVVTLLGPILVIVLCDGLLECLFRLVFFPQEPAVPWYEEPDPLNGPGSGLDPDRDRDRDRSVHPGHGHHLRGVRAPNKTGSGTLNQGA